MEPRMIKDKHNGNSASVLRDGKNADSRLPDIKPRTNIAHLRREKYAALETKFPLARVSAAVGMAPSFIHKVCGRKEFLSVQDVILLLDQDAFKETVVPRSMVIEYLLADHTKTTKRTAVLPDDADHALLIGDVL